MNSCLCIDGQSESKTAFETILYNSVLIMLVVQTPYQNRFEYLRSIVENANIEALMRRQNQICTLAITIYQSITQQTIGQQEINLNLVLLLASIQCKIYQQLGKGSIAPSQAMKFLYIFKKILHRKETNQPRDESVIQQKNVIIDHAKNINNFLLQATHPILPDSSCVNCSESFYQGWEIKANKQIKITSLQNFDFEDEQKDHILASYILGALNSGHGLLLIGVRVVYRNKQKKMIAEGININSEAKSKIFQKIQNIKEKHIFPSKLEGIFKVSFVPVLPNFITSQLKKPAISSTSQYQKQINQPYIVRIFATNLTNKIYFYLNENKEKNDIKKQYKLMKFPVQNQKYVEQYNLQKTYSVMLCVAKNKQKFHIHKNIKCKQLPTDFKIKIDNKSKDNMKNMDEYGKKPFKIYTHHSLMLFKDRGTNIFENFIEKASQNKSNFCQYKIYEKMNSINNRDVYYMTHQKKVQELENLTAKIDKQKRQLIFMKIKLNLELGKSESFNLAYNKLKEPFQKYFGVKLKTMIKQLESSSKKKEERYYFCFENEDESIFAFSLLQYENIKTLFVGESRIKHASLFEPQIVNQQILWKFGEKQKEQIGNINDNYFQQMHEYQQSQYHYPTHYNFVYNNLQHPHYFYNNPQMQEAHNQIYLPSYYQQAYSHKYQKQHEKQKGKQNQNI